MNRIKQLIPLCLLTMAGLLAKAQNTSFSYDDNVYEDQVRTVQFYRMDNPFSFPVLYLNQPASYLTLEFDELLIYTNQGASNFWVDIIHCNADWTPSRLMPIQYIDGFSYDIIYNNRHSENTYTKYIHYDYRFPGENVRIKRSGNYLLRVYRPGYRDSPTITRRFIVADHKTRINPAYGLSINVSQRTKTQNLAFDVLLSPSLQIFDPYSDLKVKILQNNRWDNMAENIRPQFVTDQKLTYDFNSSLEFKGGNEFRKLDLRSMRFLPVMIDKIIQRDTIYYVKLFKDKTRSNISYSQEFDFNGSYWIDVQEFTNPRFQSDYVLTKFALNYDRELDDGDMFVIGKFADWRCTPFNKLHYNSETRRYEAEILLKQGLYDYKYAVRKFSDGKLDEDRVEGTYFETENSYTILVYYYNQMEMADELVGILEINSLDPR